MRPSTKLLLAVFLVGCAGGTLMRDSLMAGARAENAPPPVITRYEYRIVSSTTFAGVALEDQQALLNRMGAQGWRLAGTVFGGGTFEYVFEKPGAQAVVPQVPTAHPSDGGAP